ncbi:MAG: hypothetical protein COB51_00080 [Moraxellaceae bacterium]|nr:MAG: hypothetical protein COB51_00080 [Moraxellaceae bacterium]
MKQKKMSSYYLLIGGLTVSMLGSSLSGFGICLWILDHHDSVSLFTLTAAGMTLPNLLISPFAGAMADRWSRKKVLAWSQLISAVCSMIMFVLYLNDALTVWYILSVGVIGVMASAFRIPALAASVALMVPKDQLPRANTVRSLGFGLAQLLGPAMAGFLIVAIGLEGLFVIDLLTFMVGIVAILLIYIPSPPEKIDEGKEGEGVLAQMKFGLNYLLDRKGLFWLLIFYFFVSFNVSSIMVLFMPLVRPFATQEEIGMLMSFTGVGLGLGSAIAFLWRSIEHKIRIVLGLSALLSLVLIAAPVVPSIYAVGASLFIIVLLFPSVTALSQTIWQQKVALGVQGRVFGFRAAIVGASTPMAYLLSGIFADQIFEPLMAPGGGLEATLGQVYGVGKGRGIALLVSVYGALLLVVSSLAYLNPRIRNIEKELPDFDYNEVETVKA